MQITETQGGLIKQVGNVESYFFEKMTSLVRRIDIRIARLTEQAGVKISLVPTVVSHVPELLNSHPRGWAEGETFRHVDACCLGWREILIAQGCLDVHGCLNDSKRWRGAFFHELGHAVDFALGWFSNSKSFIEAYLADVSEIIGTPWEECFLYCLQGLELSNSSSAGLEETFAEVYAALSGSSGNQHETMMILYKFRRTARVVAERLSQLNSSLSY